jgi:adenosylcobinamide kinase / adenosylcobinamide-phosphate guanylyltransferase
MPRFAHRCVGFIVGQSARCRCFVLAAGALGENKPMSEMLRLVQTELLLGGQRSGKSARAERLAAQWLAASPAHEAVLLATATAYDDEMRERIARHQADRAQRVPRMRTVQEPVRLAATLLEISNPQTLVVVDCLTLWLTNLLMPMMSSNFEGNQALPVKESAQGATDLIVSLAACTGPVVLVSNEIGLGVIPMGREVRAFVDELGRLNQSVAAACERVTLMAAGCALTLKGSV